MDYQLFGALDVRFNGRAPDLGPPKQRALLAILLLHAGEIVSLDRIIDLLWGDDPPRTAAHSIQVYVSELRKTLEPLEGRSVIATAQSGYLIEADPESIDVLRFERLVAAGIHALSNRDLEFGAATVREALELWTGAPLSDFAYQDFAADAIRRLEALRVDAIEGLAAAELEEGRAREALQLLETAISIDPLRERLRELWMLALYRLGRHPEALAGFQRFHGLLADELGLDPTPAIRQLYERMLLHDPSLGPEPAVDAAAGARLRNPYKGLRPFREQDAEDFFGRGDQVAEILARLASGARLLALIGPSGCGKSSVVRAGVIPALRAKSVNGGPKPVIARMTPGLHPFEELEAALSGAWDDPASGPLSVGEDDGGLVEAARRILPEGGRLVLVIDQFEELFSLADASVTARFLRNIAAAATDPARQVVVVMTLRADFFDRPLTHPAFAPLFSAGAVNVLPMTAAQIEAAVTGPARKVGIDVQPAVLAALVADTSDQLGALPLLQYALTELFERRTGPTLTLHDYEALGGLHGLLSRRAEELFVRLGDDKQQVAFQIFARLVQVGEGTKPSRRRIPVAQIADLDLDPVALSIVLDEFGRHRLVSFDREPTSGSPTVEVAHEALFWEWDRLAGWIERYREDLRRHRVLTAAAEEWEASNHDPDFLITGSRLTALEEWSRQTTLRLSSAEHRFLNQALDLRGAHEAEEVARRDLQVGLERRPGAGSEHSLWPWFCSAR